MTVTATRTGGPGAVAPRPAAVPIPFARLVRVEWDKCLGTRATRWLLAVATAVSVLCQLVPLLLPDDVDQWASVYLGLGSVGFGVLLPVVVILALTSEWTQRTVLVTFTQEPRRARVLTAKITVGVILALLAVVATFVIGLGGMAVAEWGLGRSVVADRPWGLLVLGLVLASVVGTVSAMGFAALFGSSAAAIVSVYLIPTLWGVVFSFGVLRKLSPWLDSAQSVTWMQEARFDGHLGQMAVSSALWVLVPLVAGFVRTLRREVS
ncbi:ABC transporter permease [Parafrankia sp. FMc6]|uniref:ABC transporter permease n=1 Tax=Parafrankia soli TaxID=2599596 RepID=UPI0034D636C6